MQVLDAVSSALQLSQEQIRDFCIPDHMWSVSELLIAVSALRICPKAILEGIPEYVALVEQLQHVWALSGIAEVSMHDGALYDSNKRKHPVDAQYVPTELKKSCSRAV